MNVHIRICVHAYMLVSVCTDLYNAWEGGRGVEWAKTGACEKIRGQAVRTFA